jgi:hypothetical protein
MKTLLRIIASLLLTIVFLCACFLGAITLLTGLWLHTYNVFTAKTLVAEVTISEIREDTSGRYMNVAFIPFTQQSALSYLISPTDDQSNRNKPQEFKIYGDTVYVSAPEVLFHENLYLLNFQTIFKLGKIFGRYDIDNQEELDREVISSFDLLGGIDPTWVALSERQAEFPYSAFIRSVQVTSAGQFGLTSQKKYHLYMNVNGLEWQEAR